VVARLIVNAAPHTTARSMLGVRNHELGHHHDQGSRSVAARNEPSI
jgi:hypothetical protein